MQSLALTGVAPGAAVDLGADAHSGLNASVDRSFVQLSRFFYRTQLKGIGNTFSEFAKDDYDAHAAKVGSNPISCSALD